jgi:hypothetical protein
MVTKNEGSREGDSNSASVWHCCDRGYIIFTSPIGGANKKGDALQNLHCFPYSLRHRLLIKL